MQAYYRQQQLLLQQRHQRQQGAPPLMLSSTALPTQQGPLKQQPQQQLPHLVLPPLLMSQQHGLQPGAPLILSSMPAGGAQQGAVLGQHGSGAGLGQKRGMPDDFQASCLSSVMTLALAIRLLVVMRAVGRICTTRLHRLSDTPQAASQVAYSTAGWPGVQAATD